MKHLNQTLVKAASRAAAVFNLEGWTWIVRDGQKVPAYTPDRLALYDNLIDKLEHLSNEQDVISISSGRLMADRDDDGAITLYLEIGWFDAFGASSDG